MNYYRPVFTMTHADGSHSQWETAGWVALKDAPEAWTQILCWALRSGWTPPRWWQVWRIADEPRDLMPPEQVRNEMARRALEEDQSAVAEAVEV